MHHLPMDQSRETALFQNRWTMVLDARQRNRPRPRRMPICCRQGSAGKYRRSRNPHHHAQRSRVWTQFPLRRAFIASITSLCGRCTSRVLYLLRLPLPLRTRSHRVRIQLHRNNDRCGGTRHIVLRPRARRLRRRCHCHFQRMHVSPPQRLRQRMQMGHRTTAPPLSQRNASEANQGRRMRGHPSQIPRKLRSSAKY